ncbi:universal stress protein [Natronorubrum sp. JWXQ-INN-674]|uniref:Universal stress protein n=1 Tax=Natronorubrum halalkaliphilum TaxID=2691917 RepID=A0A6B0VPD1_9EURY|nr:universal stress protein [Natronorubrum halalkaliphilum]
MPVDGDDTSARRQIEAIAELPDASNAVEVILYHVFEELDQAADGEGGAYLDDLYEDRDPPKSITTAESLLEEADIEYETVIEIGDPGENVVNTAKKRDVNGIIMGGRKRSPIGKVLFGSVTQAVILSSNLPVTVVGQEP